MASRKTKPAIGIYLGTEYSCVGVWHNGRVDIIPNDQGNRTTPSFVAFMPDGRRLIGEAAENQADRNPTNTIFDINRLIGRRFSDPTVQSNKKLWPFKVIEGAGDKPKIVVQYRGEEKLYYPEEISAMILAKMKEIAENFLECSVRDAVVTVPAYFNNSQRRATRNAGAIAGLNVMCIMDEPTAAAVAYSLNVCMLDEPTVAAAAYSSNMNYRFIEYALVFNLSISSFDVAVVENNKGVFKVKTTAGDMHLGGKDFDNNLFNYFLQQIKRKHKKDISDNPSSIRMLRSACERTKKALSFDIVTTVYVDGLDEGIDFSLNISRVPFDDINMDLFERCMRLVTKCLEDARMEKNDIDKVVLVGGNTRIPMVQQMLQELFDGKELCKSIDLNSVVAYGATLQSGMMNSCTPDMKARREVENANQEMLGLQREFLAAHKLTEKLMSERDDAKRLTQQVMSERDDARKLSETAQKQLMSERDDAIKLSEIAQKQLMSERDDARKLSEATQKHRKQLLSERDDATKFLETVQKQLMSELDDAKKCSEAAQKHIEQLISERDYAIKQVEELHWLTEQQAPCRKCVGCFIGYSYSELQHATDNFNESFKLGEGGFGKVYKGILHDTTIAIKIMNEGSSQGVKEFYQEVEVLSKLQHPNLVKLIGACAENHALIYEYLPNGSLEDRIRCKDNTSPLSWQARVHIAFEICSALSFLHCSKPHGIVHGDLKPDNVLLDLNNVSKLSDFGLCRQLNWTTNASRPFYFTDCPKGTFGYIDPEYFTTVKMTPQNDVYSFGIMLLQLVTCKDPRGIRQPVEEAHRKGTLKALIDASAGPWPFKEAEKMILLGLSCSDTMRTNRPDLSTIVWKEMKSMADVASASQSSWPASLFQIGNADQEKVALQCELSQAQKLIEKLMSEGGDTKRLIQQLMYKRDDARKLSEVAQKQLMCERDDTRKLLEVIKKHTKQLMSERDDATKLSEAVQKQLMSERYDTIKLSKMAQKQLVRERDDARKLSQATQKHTKQLLSERDDAKKHSEAAQKLIDQLISERDCAIKQVEEFRWLTEQHAPCRKCVGCLIGYSYSELQHATDNSTSHLNLEKVDLAKCTRASSTILPLQ